MPLDVELTEPQSQFFSDPKKYSAFVGGFGSGKSHALFIKMLNDKLQSPKIDIGYFAPSYQLVRDIAYPRVQNLLDEAGLKYKLNKAENNIAIENYGLMRFRSMDIPDRIVGFEIGSAYIDELDTMSFDSAENAWNKIVARCRQTHAKHPDYMNRVSVATTPEGYNFVHHKWVKTATEQYSLIKAPTASNPHLPPDYIDSLRETYPAALIEAYLNGEFVNLVSKAVYSNFDRVKNHSDREIEERETLHIGMDFNVRNMNAIVHVMDDSDTENTQVYAVDELVELADTPAMVDAIKDKFPKHKIYVYPDSTGNNPKSTDASKSDLTILKKAGFYVKAKTKNPYIKDRVSSMNIMFGNTDFNVRYFVNTDKCPDYTESLEQQVYDKNGLPEKSASNSIDDRNDAGGYFIAYKFPVSRKQFKEIHVRSY